MPKLRLFREDPFDADIIPFPRLNSEEQRFRLRLVDAATEAEQAISRVQAKLDEARRVLNAGWWYDDDGPRAA